MTTNDIRQKYLEFFEKRGHKIIPPAPLVLQNDPTTLFTSSGMQPLVPFLMGEPHPGGVRLVDSQPAVRLQDIEDVGDNRHTTFFEMLGNWSLGDYFKKEQLNWIFEFLTGPEGLNLDPQKLYVSIFEGNDSVPKDEESIAIWKDIFKKHNIEAIEGERIFAYDAKKNWWSRSGVPEKMPVGEIGGPDSEIFYDFGAELKLHENSQWKDETCHPNCDCGRFVEIGNSVFIQYKKKEDGTLEELPQKNVDFGGGFERLGAALINSPDVFKTDLFMPVIEQIEQASGKQYADEANQTAIRIIADHLRASAFLIKSGVIPSNKAQGYVLRRLLRRAAVKMRQLLNGQLTDPTVFNSSIGTIITAYDGIYFETSDTALIAQVVGDELKKFMGTLEKGMKELNKLETIDGNVAFNLFQTYGFPLELTLELAQEKGQDINVEEFKQAFAKHQDLSRTQSAGVFKGGLADHSEETTRLHTATHLLHKALRTVLGDHVQQKGSNITAERLRFDFVHDAKLTDEQKKQIEDMVNAEIDKDLPVSFATMSLEQAKDEGALAFFGERYADLVKVYTVGDPQGEWFSKEVCGGPHVTHLAELGGHVTITKEESVGGGVRRIYATISA